MCRQGAPSRFSEGSFNCPVPENADHKEQLRQAGVCTWHSVVFVVAHIWVRCSFTG